MPRRQRTPMTWNEHVKLGNKIKKISDYLLRINVDLDSRYGKTKTFVRLLNRMTDINGIFSKLKDTLEHQLGLDHPDRDGLGTDIVLVYCGAIDALQPESRKSEFEEKR